MKKMDVKYEVSIPEGRVDTDDHYCPSIYVCKNLDEIKSFKDVFCYESDYEPKNVLNMATMISENCAAIGRLDQIPIFVIYTQPGDTESLCSTENFASAYHFDLYSAGALGMTRYLPMGKVILDPYMGINDLNEMLQEIEDSANSVGLNSYRGILYIRMEGYSYEDISLENKLLMYIVRKLLNKTTLILGRYLTRRRR